MRPSPHSVRSVVALAAAALLLAGCTAGQPRDPGEYGAVNGKNEGYYGNLMFGCTGVRANSDGEYVDVELESPDFCTCVFRGMKETVPFPDAKAFDEAQADAEDGETIDLPENINRVRTRCAENEAAFD